MSAAGNVFYLTLADLEGCDLSTLAMKVCGGRVVAADGGEPLPTDGLIVGDSGRGAQRMFNPDGSEGMCANGLRCLAHLFHRLQVPLSGGGILTCDGLKRVQVDGERVRAELGRPRPLRNRVEGPEQPFTLECAGEPITGHGVFVGNPHFVVFTDSVTQGRIAEIGPLLERHPEFPDGVNVEIAVRAGDKLNVRVWERGVGETRSCGTGAVAVAAAAGIGMHQVLRVSYPGGDLEVERDGDGILFLAGSVMREGRYYYRET